MGSGSDPVQRALDERSHMVSAVLSSFVHEINNPLSAVLSNLSMAADVVDELQPSSAEAANVSELREMLADCKTALESIDKLVRDLRLFARFDGTITEPQPLGPLTASVVRTMRHALGRKGRVTLEIGSAVRVRIVPAIWAHVLSGILADALRAVQGTSPSSHEISLRIVEHDERVHVELKLEGPTVDPELALNEGPEARNPWLIGFSRRWLAQHAADLKVTRAHHMLCATIVFPKS